MKGTLFCLLLFVARLSRANDLSLLECIAEVATGNDPAVVGRSGEVTAYQILPRNWKCCTDKSVAYATDPSLALTVALRHLTYIKRLLRIYHREFTKDQLENPLILALAWKCGPCASVHSDADLDYAIRVRNLYLEREIQKHRGSLVKPAPNPHRIGTLY